MQSDPDGGLVHDAGRRVDVRVPTCGDGHFDPGERCDDGNREPDDGCDATCRREPYCGDGVVNRDEVCDDGHHRSNDGCRSDCRSDETCGNGIVDYATGEICDDGPGTTCTADCGMIARCGDGATTAPEVCDDGNLERWDACDTGCTEPLSFVLDVPQFVGRGVGCDYSGDGVPDNQLGLGAGSALALLNPYFGSGLPTFMVSFMGVEDPRAADDASLRVAWLHVFDLGGTYVVDRSVLADDGAPATSVEATIAGSMLWGGPEDLEFEAPFLPLLLHDAFIRGTIDSVGGRPSGISEGLVCGVVSLASLAGATESLVETYAAGAGLSVDVPPPCDGGAESSLADWLVGGALVAGVRIRPTSPDVDLAGDGLGSFEVRTESASGEVCQPVITACIDSDGLDGVGTRIEGRDCIFDARIDDGFSSAMRYTASRTTTSGAR